MQLKYIIAALMVLCLLAAPATVQAEKSVIGCEICEWLVATAEGFVNKTKPQIEQELLQICAKLGPYEQICDQLVLMELPDIIDQIIAKEPPAIVCSQVKICNGSAMAVAAPKAENSGICNMCQLLVTQVGKLIWVSYVIYIFLISIITMTNSRTIDLIITIIRFFLLLPANHCRDSHWCRRYCHHRQ